MSAAGALVGDVGGTTARFARCDPGGLPGPAIELASAGHDGLAGALAEAGRRLGSAAQASVAVAGPVAGDDVELTNVGWRFSIERTRAELGLGRLLVVNDFAALARSLPELGEGELESVKAGVPAAGAAWAILGPGTGLGVASLVPAPGGWTVAAGEGGHRDLAAADEREWRVVERLAARYGHVSAERALSGPGLAALHQAICELDGRVGPAMGPAEVAAAARAGGSHAAAEACRLFSAWLGAVAGDLALTVGARGGVALAGGVLGGLGDAFDRALFVERFLAKGRFRAWLEPVPVVRLLDPVRATLRGAALLLG